MRAGSSLMNERGVLRYIDAVGFMAFPVRLNLAWRGWNQEAGDVREYLSRLRPEAGDLDHATGFSTWRGDERAQVRAFVDAVDAPVERVYWQEA